MCERADLMENWGSVLRHSLCRCCGKHVRASLPEGRGSPSTYPLYPICHGGGLLHGAFPPRPWWSAQCVEFNTPLLPEKARVSGSCRKKCLVYIEIVNAKGMGQGSDTACNNPPPQKTIQTITGHVEQKSLQPMENWKLLPPVHPLVL